ncbi:hypothetical protein SUGI_0290460 [Cryptomeria japonica]|nr:hypothetical protein SUGI_0290460 [Cryptomeria japonica]
MFKTGQTIIPVFYNVDVNDIRWMKGRYAQEFSKFEAKNRYRPEKVEDWKSALQKVSYLKGHIVNSEEYRRCQNIGKGRFGNLISSCHGTESSAGVERMEDRGRRD